MAKDPDKIEKARKRAVLFSTGIGAGIGGGSTRLLHEGLRPLEYFAEGHAGRLAAIARRTPHVVQAFVAPVAVVGGVMGAREKKLQLEMAGDPRKRREYMRATGIAPVASPPSQKTASIDVPPDSGRLISGRDSYAQGTEGVEQANVSNVQELLDVAFANKAKMSQRVEEQLKELYPRGAGKSYGRARSAGLPASEVSSMVSHAFASAPKEPSNR